MKAGENPDRGSHDWVRFLAWLHPDPALAGQVYEELRTALTLFFSARGCGADEAELVDTTFDRAIAKLDESKAGPNPRSLLYGIARYVYLEYTRRPKVVPLEYDVRVDDRPEPEGLAHKHECLERCIATLPSEDRALLLSYYQFGRGEDRIGQRRNTALEDNATLNSCLKSAHEQTSDTRN
jgi:DNA-directed RNA polymerase specialized sigma24 family protein